MFLLLLFMRLFFVCMVCLCFKLVTWSLWTAWHFLIYMQCFESFHDEGNLTNEYCSCGWVCLHYAEQDVLHKLDLPSTRNVDHSKLKEKAMVVLIFLWVLSRMWILTECIGLTSLICYCFRILDNCQQHSLQNITVLFIACKIYILCI